MGVDDRAARPRPLPELLLVSALFLAYKLGRLAIAGDLNAAYANATRVWRLERLWRLPSETGLQHAILAHDWLVRAANLYYTGAHFPATIALLLWTYFRRPQLYRWARTILTALTATAFAIHALIPLAPPRLLPQFGMVDTGRLLGPSAYGDPATDTLANQYAAMPSLHVGWAAAVAVVLIVAGRSRWRWLWLLHPLVTLVVVVVTANHYWLDAFVALALLGAALLVLAVPRVRTPVGESGRSRVRGLPARGSGLAATPISVAASISAGVPVSGDESLPAISAIAGEQQAA